MLTTYSRIMREHRIKLSTLQVKMLEEKLQRTDAPGVSEEMMVPGVRVAQVMAKAAKTALALFSLAYLAACATPAHQYDQPYAPHTFVVSPWEEHVTVPIEQVWAR